MVLFKSEAQMLDINGKVYPDKIFLPVLVSAVLLPKAVSQNTTKQSNSLMKIIDQSQKLCTVYNCISAKDKISAHNAFIVSQ